MKDTKKTLQMALLSIGLLAGLFSFSAPLGLGGTAAIAGSKGDGKAGESKWTADDLLLEERAVSWAFSHDGKMAVWVKSGFENVDGEYVRMSNLFLSRLTEGATLQITHGKNDNRSPAFSPDGKWIAFLSDRQAPGAKGVQIWAMAVPEGEPFLVTRFERGVRSFAWKDPQSFVAAVQESQAPGNEKNSRSEDDSIVAGEAGLEPTVRLFLVSFKEGHAKRLTENSGRIRSLCVDGQGRTALISVNEARAQSSNPFIPPAIYLVDLASGSMKRVLLDESLRPSTIRWSPDGRGFYFHNLHFRHPKQRWPGIVELHYYDRANERSQKIDVGWSRGMGREFCPISDGVIAFIVDGVYFRPVKLVRGPSGWRQIGLTGPHVPHFTEFLADRSGTRIVYEYSQPNLPPQWHAATLDGAKMVRERKITDLNKHHQLKPLGKTEIVTWKGAQGVEVEGILYYPLDYVAGKRCPLVLDIHGGPTSSNLSTWTHDWASPVILWQQKGAFVLQANYHGSLGYGLDWVESLGGHYLDWDLVDLEKGVDELIARGLVDSDKLAVSGWSNGGRLSLGLIIRSNRFKAASVGAGATVDYAVEWGSDDYGPAFADYIFDGAPWEIPQAYIDKSPIFKLDKVVTPTLILTGNEDRSAPYHSWILFRAIRKIGKAPVRLVLFPGEGHALGGAVHQRRKIAEDLAWFDRYLFSKSDS